MFLSSLQSLSCLIRAYRHALAGSPWQYLPAICAWCTNSCSSSIRCITLMELKRTFERKEDVRLCKYTLVATIHAYACVTTLQVLASLRSSRVQTCPQQFLSLSGQPSATSCTLGAPSAKHALGRMVLHVLQAHSKLIPAGNT